MASLTSRNDCFGATISEPSAAEIGPGPAVPARAKSAVLRTLRRCPSDRVRADVCLKSRRSSLLVASIMDLPALTQQGIGDELLFGTQRWQVTPHQFEAPRLLFPPLLS